MGKKGQTFMHLSGERMRAVIVFLFFLFRVHADVANVEESIASVLSELDDDAIFADLHEAEEENGSDGAHVEGDELEEYWFDSPEDVDKSIKRILSDA